MINTLLITGCSRGLGQALALRFSQAGCRVYAVGRDENLLSELAKTSSCIDPIVADICSKKGKETIIQRINNIKALSIIHNAAIAQPCPFDSLEEHLLVKHLETNFLAPLVLTQKLLPSISPNQRILHISSGAADLALPGLMPYCTSKAAMEHAMRCLNAELNLRNIFCANLRPGMMNTPMQDNLRNADRRMLSNRDFYIEAEKEGKLLAPEIVAEFVAWVMLKTENILFSETTWNVYDVTHYASWLPDNYQKPIAL